MSNRLLYAIAFLVLFSCYTGRTTSALKAEQGYCTSLPTVEARLECKASAIRQQSVDEEENDDEDVLGVEDEEETNDVDEMEMEEEDSNDDVDVMDDENLTPTEYFIVWWSTISSFINNLWKTTDDGYVISDFTVRLGCIISLVILVIFEFWYRFHFDDDVDDDYYESAKFQKRSTKRLVDYSLPPVHKGPLLRDRYAQDFLNLGRCIPLHRRIAKPTWSRSSNVISSNNVYGGSPGRSTHSNGAYRGDPATIQQFPHSMPGTRAFNEMQRLFPDANESEIVRFLIARKGVVEHSSAMLRAARQWHTTNFPSKLKEIIPALKTGCIFAHGQALDGTPTLYFRSALYDSKAATAMQYTLAAAYVIDNILASTNQSAVTVIVCVAQVPGAPNEGADLNFIKSFVKVLSDNYPERLRRLVLYPFPLFGRVVWSIVKLFVDKRSQEKVVLLPGDGDGNLPEQLLNYVDRSAVPQCCGGLDLCAVEDTMADIIARANDATLITAGGGGGDTSVHDTNSGSGDDEAKLDADDLLAKDMKLLGLKEENS